MTTHCLKFNHRLDGSLPQLLNALQVLTADPSGIDKLKLRLKDGDLQTMGVVLNAIKHQNFLKEISFYKMSFQTQPEFEWLSQVLRVSGLEKASFKDCKIKEGMIG